MSKLTHSLAAALFALVAPTSAFAQSPSCTAVAVGATQEITAFGVCKKITLDNVPSPSSGVAGICAPTNIDAAQWASFYNNPPPGVTVAECGGGSCPSPGFSYGGYCYYWQSDGDPLSCQDFCPNYGSCIEAGTRHIGSDDPSGARCATVATALAGTSVSVFADPSGAHGCGKTYIKGGWFGYNYFSPATTCAQGGIVGRICACGDITPDPIDWTNLSQTIPWNVGQRTISGITMPITLRVTGDTSCVLYKKNNLGGWSDPTGVDIVVNNNDTLAFLNMNGSAWPCNLTVRNLTDGNALIDTFQAYWP